MYWFGLILGLILGFMQGSVFGPSIILHFKRKAYVKRLQKEREIEAKYKEGEREEPVS